MRGRNALRNSPVSEKDFEIDLSKDGWVIKKYCGFDKKMLRIPSVIDGKKIVEIGENAFCNLHAIQYVSVDSGIVSIGKEAFCCCSSLRQIFLPDTLRYIYDGAFSNCVNLYDAALPNTITHIGEEAFFCCYPLYNSDSHRPNISSVISGYKQPSKSAQSIEITGFIEKSKPSQIIFLYTLLPLTA